MKKLNFLIIAIAGSFLASCNGDGKDNNCDGGGRTKYQLQNYVFASVGDQKGCSLVEDDTINCVQNQEINGKYYISFNSPVGKTGPYVKMPPSGNLNGLTIQAADEGCSQTYPNGGETYRCTFTIKADQNKAKVGVVPLKVVGLSGKVEVARININSASK